MEEELLSADMPAPVITAPSHFWADGMSGIMRIDTDCTILAYFWGV